MRQQQQRSSQRCSGAGLTLAWLMIRPMNVDTSLDRDNDGLFRCSSCLSRGKAVGSSGTVTVYECRRLGMAALLNVVRYQDGGDIHSEIPAAGWSQYSGGISGVRWCLEAVGVCCPAPVCNINRGGVCRSFYCVLWTSPPTHTTLTLPSSAVGNYKTLLLVH